jgi:tRNA A-37 threonylcarbamoyl transferase component Bud32
MKMTWAESRIGRSMSRTGVLLKTQTWIFPLLAIVVLACIGYFVRSAIERTMKNSLQSQLETLLSVETAMLKTWFKVQEANAQSQANDLQVRSHVEDLLKVVDPETPVTTPLRSSPIHSLLRKELAPILSTHDYYGYFVADKSGLIMSSDAVELIGVSEGPIEVENLVSRVFAGETVVTTPIPSRVLMKDEAGKLRSGVPTMWVCAPVRDAAFQPIAVLGLRIRPEREFTRILQLGQFGSTGETYAFDKGGRMVSNSRFDDSLILMGLIPDELGARSLLNVLVRDPGGDLTAGFRPSQRRSALPLTKMAAEAVDGRDGLDLTGYRDYRGVPVIGAWLYLPQYRIGIATEIDRAEAFRPISILKWTFAGLYALLFLAALAIFIFSVIVARMRRAAQKAALETQKLGQYTLEKKLGAGAMGVVYKGHHAVLRRPTAIKMLQLDRANEGTIERFEREVQITCQLNHPNTVAIYDYGRTPEGLFYYAMEFLDGIDLQSLVEKYGPQSEGRVIHILQQICGSLYEAHSLGLVHRDIKPANVMLNRRGGEPDVVKVLDFGLVKAIDEEKQAGLTAANTLTGTPLYMSPESIQTPGAVDPRSDLYAVGAVGYFLLTGKPVFDASNIVELCQKHVSEQPATPSVRIGRPVSEALESAILACLEKSRAKRPQTARDLALSLSRVATAGTWTVEDGEGWWGRHERGTPMPAATPSAPAKTATSGGSPPFDRTIISDG